VQNLLGGNELPAFSSHHSCVITKNCKQTPDNWASSPWPTNLAVDRWYHCFLAVSSDIDVQVDSAEVAWNSIIPFRM
jgi:hypothetical protein